MKLYITVCPNGTFILNKECVDCPGHCKDGESCNKLTGMCNNGCADHWNRTFCESMYYWFVKSLSTFAIITLNVSYIVILETIQETLFK